jgi:hypothetical protein
MKINFINFSVIIGFFLFILFASSCKKNQENTLSNIIEKENNHIAKNLIEKPEERANEIDSSEIKEEIDGDPTLISQLDSLLREKAGRFVLASGGRVGVLKDGTCDGHDELTIMMDCENNIASTTESQPTGASFVVHNREFIGDADVEWHYCIVDGDVFGQGRFPYGVLAIDGVYNNSATKFVSIFQDNEDNNNNNRVDINNTNMYGQDWGGVTGGGPNHIDNNSDLWYIVYGEDLVTGGFPNLGFSYYVFGTDPNVSADNGSIYCDDEDYKNVNRFIITDILNNTVTSNYYIVPGVFQQMGGGGYPNKNTNFHITRAN